LRKTISFTEQYKKEYEYICKLIRKDRLKQNENTEDKILKLLNRIMKNGRIETAQNNASHQKKKALKNILNM